MSVSTTTNRKDYTGNGATTVYAYDFLILSSADLKVYLDGALKTLTTHYTVSGVGVDGGGNVTFVAAPGNTLPIVIVRDPPLTQAVDYVENEKFPADTHERALDKLTMIAQKLTEAFGRAIKFPVTSLLQDIDFPEGTGASNRATKLPRWNAAGTALELVTVGTDAISGVITTLGDVIQGGTSGIPERLASGARGAVLSVSSALKAAWLALGAKGGVLVSNGTDPSWLAVGANDTVLVADSAQAAGVKWIAPLFPLGTLVAYAGAAAPTDWLLCYGQAISRTTYAALFAILATAYGVGDGATTFNLPDLRGRNPLGKDDMGGSAASRVAAATTLGGTGGTNEGAHVHAAAGLSTSASATAAAEGGGAANASGKNHVHDIAGSTASTSVLAPYQVFNWIIRAL